MNTFGECINRLFRRNHEQAQPSFKDAYRHFKCLISANNKALEIMARIEDCLNGEDSFDMVQVRTMCTQVTTAVYQLVREMEKMAPGKYRKLQRQVEKISSQIRPVIEAVPPLPRGLLVYPLHTVTLEKAPRVGHKMAVLGEILSKTDIPVADGFVVSAKGYWRFMQHEGLGEEIDRLLRTAPTDTVEEMQATYSRIRQLIVSSSLPVELQQAIADNALEIESKNHLEPRFAVRSSALGEDSPGCSFAGQYSSILNVGYAHLGEAYKEVVASKYEPQAVSYRRARGIVDSNIAVCVGIQQMVESACGGVVYTKNPLEEYGSGVLIYGSLGLAQGVVSGRVDVDRFVVSRRVPHTVKARELTEKKEYCRAANGEGIRWEHVGDGAALQPVLSDEQLAKLAAVSLKLETLFSEPQDIEWAIGRDGAITILQSRPLMTLRQQNTAGASAEHVSHEELLFAGGETASSGIAAGKIFHAQYNADMLQFPKGSVLVVKYADPQWAAMLPYASAVISEKGTLTGHLANVAREFGIPALFGVSDVFGQLEDGVDVTVVASEQKILRGVHAELVAQYVPPHSSIKDTPVYNALKNVARHITPLYLTNPDTRYFRIDECRTLHDITRFCHERAVTELFSTGMSKRYQRYPSYRLFTDRPMQFWVLNLDNGFGQEPEGKFVALENIASTPMRALWDGMMAVEWEGPPPINAKGFLSILAQSATTPGIEPGAGSAYSLKNYFFVSRSFCSLQSRFGYHFCSVEAIAGEHAAENFIGFRFTGGAANRERRILRVQFVESLLQQFGFRTRTVGDSLSARVQGRELDEMKRLLRVVGYLIIHTRQLDMAMTSAAFVSRKREQFLQELRDMLEASG